MDVGVPVDVGLVGVFEGVYVKVAVGGRKGVFVIEGVNVAVGVDVDVGVDDGVKVGVLV